MAVVATQLVAEITNRFPGTWDFTNPAQFNRRWLDAICLGFQTMWVAGIMSPGLGPPPPGPLPHTHLLTVFVPATMSGPAKAIGVGKEGITGTFADTIAIQVSAFLISNTVMSIVDGAVPHIHAFTPLPATFGQGTALANQIKSALTSTGLFQVETSVLPLWLQAFSDGLIAHLTAAASMTLISGAAHIHVLL